MTADATLRELIRAAAATEGELPEVRTTAVRKLAYAVVDYRVEHNDPQGRTWHYRQAMNDAYADARVTGQTASRLKAAVRYHVGGILRERGLGDEQLLDESPRERSTRRYREGRR